MQTDFLKFEYNTLMETTGFIVYNNTINFWARQSKIKTMCTHNKITIQYYISYYKIDVAAITCSR